MPMLTMASIASSSVQSKWEISRRSICTWVTFSAHLTTVLGWLVDRYVFLDHFFCGGRGGIAAMAAVLDQHDHGNLRVVDRRVGNKPCVIAAKVRQLLTF